MMNDAVSPTKTIKRKLIPSSENVGVSLYDDDHNETNEMKIIDGTVNDIAPSAEKIPRGQVELSNQLASSSRGESSAPVIDCNVLFKL